MRVRSHGVLRVAALLSRVPTTPEIRQLTGIPRTTEMFVQRPQDVSALLDWLYARPADDPLRGRLNDDVALAGHSYGGWNVFATVGAD